MLTHPGRRISHAKATARFNGIIASAMDAIISLDADQHIILSNPAADQMCGVTAPDALGQVPARGGGGCFPGAFPL